MDSKQRKVFMQVMEDRNLSVAAKVLSISQPAVTAVIKRLEAEFGAELFSRNGKSLIPNHQARLLYNMALEMKFNEDLAKMSALLSEQTPENVIISVNAYSDAFFTMAGIYSREHPECCFIFKSDVSPDSGYFSASDMDLTYRYMVQGRRSFSVDVQRKLYAILPVTHPLADSRRLNLIDLRDEYFVFTKGNGRDGYESGYDECTSVGFRPKVSLAVEVPAAKYSAVAVGCGIGLLYNTELKLAETVKNCVLVELGAVKNVQPICLAWREGEINPSADRFLRWIKRYRMGGQPAGEKGLGGDRI